MSSIRGELTVIWTADFEFKGRIRYPIYLQLCLEKFYSPLAIPYRLQPDHLTCLENVPELRLGPAEGQGLRTRHPEDPNPTHRLHHARRQQTT